MIIPKFWASSKRQHRTKGKRATIQRWGWSDLSQEDAKRHADARLELAMESLIKDWPRVSILKREPKVPYNGAEGVPIREEVIVKLDMGVITRNAYGALCLNTPSAMFVDVDADLARATPVLWKRCAWLLGIITALTLWMLWLAHSAAFPGASSACPSTCPDSAFRVFLRSAWQLIWTGALSVIAWRLVLGLIWRMQIQLRGGVLALVKRSLAKIGESGLWAIYETPAGLRLLALHKAFDPSGEESAAIMKRLSADPLYAAMCRRQQCFRARVSPKPWRIPGMDRMRGPVWPVEGDALVRRSAWVAEYSPHAEAYASCAFVETVGSGEACEEVSRVRDWHDNLCQAHSGKPLA